MEVQEHVPVSTSEEMTNTTPTLQPFTSIEEKSLPTVPFFDVILVLLNVNNPILSLM